MEAILRKMEETNKLLREDIRNCRQKDLEIIKKEIKKGNEEIQEEIRKREEEWKVEKAAMKIDIQNLKETVGKLKKNILSNLGKERRNNLIINTKLTQTEKLDVTIKKIIKDDLNLTVKVEEITYLTKTKYGNDLIKVKLNNREDKIKVMSNKYKLKGKQVFINDDNQRREADTS